MDIIGSVAPEEVPQGESRMGRPGKWSVLADRAVAEAMQGRVLVVRPKDEKELKSLRAGFTIPLKKRGYKAHLVVVRQGAEYRVFIELRLREPQVEAQPPIMAAVAPEPPVLNANRPVAEAWGNGH